MSEFKVNTITNRDGSYGPQVCGITTFRSSGMQLPSGPTEMRGVRGKGVFGAGATPSSTSVMDAIQISTTGNAVDFGDDFLSRQENYAAFGSTIRGINAGGYDSPTAITNIHYFTFSSQGGMNDFGQLINARYSCQGASNAIRGLIFGGRQINEVSHNAIEFVTIATTGDAVSFGSLTEHVFNHGSGVSTPTRAFQFAGLTNSGPTRTNVIHAATIATQGDAVKFGELTISPDAHTGCSNSIRGLSWCGQTPSNIDNIEYFQLASEGNGVDFGDASAAKDYLGACASSTRGMCAGGQTPTKINVIEYVSFSTTGDTTDFGDLTVARRFCMGSSDVHGGLAQ